MFYKPPKTGKTFHFHLHFSFILSLLLFMKKIFAVCRRKNINIFYIIIKIYPFFLLLLLLVALRRHLFCFTINAEFSFCKQCLNLNICFYCPFNCGFYRKIQCNWLKIFNVIFKRKVMKWQNWDWPVFNADIVEVVVC